MHPLVQAAIDFVNECASRDYAAAIERMDDTMAGQLPEFVLGETWAQIVRRVGELEKVTETRTAVHLLRPSVRVVFVTCKFARTPIDFEISFDERGRVAGLVFLRPGLDG